VSPEISERSFEDAIESGRTIIVTTLQKFPVNTHAARAGVTVGGRPGVGDVERW
jgi:hypothetical protein